MKLANSYFDQSAPNSSVTHKTIAGGFWSFAIRILQQVLNAVKLVVLARFLTPQEFGLIGVALLTVAVLDTFSEAGLFQALIQKKGEIETYLDSAWTFLVIRGVILSAVVYAAAPGAAAFFNSSEATSVIRVVGMGFLLQGFVNIGVVYFQKEMQFHKQFLYQSSGIVIDSLVAICVVLQIRSVWAFVYGYLSAHCVRLVCSYIIHDYRPKLSLNSRKISELFRFGKWILGSSAVQFLITQGDSIFMGRLLGVKTLGFYQMAVKISNLTVAELGRVVSSVTFPAFAKIQDKTSRIQNGYFRVLQIVAVLTIPVGGFVSVMAIETVNVVIGKEWLVMVPVLQIMIWNGIIKAIAGVNSPVLQALHRPEIITKLSVIKLAVLAILIYPFSVTWGMTGAAAAVLVTSLVITPNTFYLTVKSVMKCGSGIIGRALIGPFIATLAYTSVIYILKPERCGILAFIGLSAAAVALYTIFLAMSDYLWKLGLYAMFRNITRRILR